MADLIRRRHKAFTPTFEVVQRLLTTPAPPPDQAVVGGAHSGHQALVAKSAARAC